MNDAELEKIEPVYFDHLISFDHGIEKESKEKTSLIMKETDLYLVPLTGLIESRLEFYFPFKEVHRGEVYKTSARRKPFFSRMKDGRLYLLSSFINLATKKSQKPMEKFLSLFEKYREKFDDDEFLYGTVEVNPFLEGYVTELSELVGVAISLIEPSGIGNPLELDEEFISVLRDNPTQRKIPSYPHPREKLQLDLERSTKHVRFCLEEGNKKIEDLTEDEVEKYLCSYSVSSTPFFLLMMVHTFLSNSSEEKKTVKEYSSREVINQEDGSSLSESDERISPEEDSPDGDNENKKRKKRNEKEKSKKKKSKKKKKKDEHDEDADSSDLSQGEDGDNESEGGESSWSNPRMFLVAEDLKGESEEEEEESSYEDVEKDESMDVDGRISVVHFASPPVNNRGINEADIMTNIEGITMVDQFTKPGFASNVLNQIPIVVPFVVDCVDFEEKKCLENTEVISVLNTDSCKTECRAIDWDLKFVLCTYRFLMVSY